MAINAADAQKMAASYAQAWTSHDPEAVASFYAEDGFISINDGEASRGRAEIEAVAQSFFTEIPDLVVRLDDLRTAGNHAVFRWTLEGTNTGPGGSGHRVKVSGWEAWRLMDDLLIAESDGRFDADEYARQLAEGI